MARKKIDIYTNNTEKNCSEECVNKTKAWVQKKQQQSNFASLTVVSVKSVSVVILKNKGFVGIMRAPSFQRNKTKVNLRG